MTTDLLPRASDDTPALAGGIDLAAVFPRYLNIRRGALIIAILSPVVNPWRLVNTATVFLTVETSYGIFLAPFAGMMAASYLVVHKKKLNIDHLYIGSADSICWYTRGINWRAPFAWIIGVTPCLPGFIAMVDTSVKVSNGAIRLFYLNYLYGFLASAAAFSALHWMFPSAKVDEFVRQEQSSLAMRQLYEDRWEMITPGLSVDSVEVGQQDLEHCKDNSIVLK